MTDNRMRWGSACSDAMRAIRILPAGGLCKTGHRFLPARPGLVLGFVSVLICSASVLQAQVYEKLFSFTDAQQNLPIKGNSPRAALVEGLDGNFYGTTSGGGGHSAGTVFRLSPAGVVTTLLEFTDQGGNNRGNSPRAALVRGPDGNFYGTTYAGGINGFGTIFKMSPAGVLNTLMDFSFPSAPQGALVQGADGNLYGTTTGGGDNGGTIFKITSEGGLTTLVGYNEFGSLGSSPEGALVLGTDGMFYGTTSAGGNFGADFGGFGTAFKMTPAGSLTKLVDFSDNGASNRGSDPGGNLVQAPDGFFYGTTELGGTNGGGTIFKMTSTGILTTLVDFTRTTLTQIGVNAGLVRGVDGNFYGTTAYGGVAALGTIFKMTTTGALTTLVEFTGNGASNRGSLPQSGLVQGSDGYLYGTTSSGGANNLGTLFKVTLSGTLVTLAEFSDPGGFPSGAQPGALLQVSDGTIYGTTTRGGTANGGTVFKITPAGDLTTLANLSSIGGAFPGRLVQSGDGNFYGTAFYNGAFSGGGGKAFKMTPAGVLTLLFNFQDPNSPMAIGSNPAALLQYSDGNFYGTTQQGGVNAQGTVFKMTSAGVVTTLSAFAVSGTGRYPGALVTDGAGNFYGGTTSGGTTNNGVIFNVTTAGGSPTPIVQFSGNGTATNRGSSPLVLIRGIDGNLYGATHAGGANQFGTIFKTTPAGVITTLVDFTGSGGTNKGNAATALVQDSTGTFYGTTNYGGGSDLGTVFKMTIAGGTATLTTLFEFTGDAVDSHPSALIVGQDGNLYGASTGSINSLTSGDGVGGIFRLVFPGPPNLYLVAPQVQSTTSALLQAKVNPRGAFTAVFVDYGLSPTNLSSTIQVAADLSGYQTTLAGTTLTGLTSASVYYYRFRASSNAGTTVSPVATFSTLAQPTAIANPATNITRNSVQFNGTVNAHNYDASVHFEYDTDMNFSAPAPVSVAAAPGTVTGNTNTSVSAPVAGLTKGTAYYYRVVAMNAGGTTVSGVTSFVTLTEPTATIGPAVALSTISAQVSGSANARGSDTQVSFEYGTDGINFPNSVSAIPATVTGNADTPVTAALHSLNQGTTYYYRIRVTSAGGVGVSAIASFSLNILSGLTQVFPGAPPPAQGFVIVTLSPSGIQSGWRFVGEQLWRASGTAVGGLTTGDRQIEFRPVPGYIQPLSETVTVTSGAPATQVTAEYFPTTAGQAGGLEVILKPDSIANTSVPVANRGQWRFLGEDDTQWRNSGVTVNGLLPGKYLVECKPIPGRNTPSPNVVPVQSNQTALATITYSSADATVGATPSVLPFQTVSTTQSLPYAYVGQIRSDVGSATGFVVNRRVVATAGHVVFDDGTLSYVTGLQWLFERDAGTYDPVPQIPQGFYVFDGYATQRTAEGTPGQSTVASQNLDVAALYFLADAGRGGYAGYLASDSTDNEFLTSSKLKMVVGYPVNGIPSANQGRMFATSPFNVTFTRVPGTDSSNNPYRVYTTTDTTSAGGNSGGPICVLYDNGSYYPAAIYLGGSAQTSVRAIDSKVVDLFGRAQVSGDGGGNQVGGGIIQVNTPISGAIFTAAALKVNLSPNNAVTNGAMWSLSPTDVPFSSGFERDNLNPVGAYTVYFSPAIGFLTPPSATITLTAGQLSTVTRTYFGVTTQPLSQIAPVGSNVTFTVATSGTPSGYQWRRNGVNISGATGSSYTLNSITSNDTATYSVVVTWTEVAPSTVTGPVSQTSSAATLTVTDTFNSWSSRFFTPTELSNAQISGPAADPDGDGVPNLLEFAFNLQPRVADRSVLIAGTGTSGLPLIRLETINNQKVLTIEFVRRRAAGSPGITYHAEFNSDLTNPNGWSETGAATVTQIDDTWERVKVTDSLVNQSRRLGRVRITMP